MKVWISVEREDWVLQNKNERAEAAGTRQKDDGHVLCAPLTQRPRSSAQRALDHPHCAIAAVCGGGLQNCTL